MNGGISTRIVRGKDYADQISTFLSSKLGSILLADVDLSYSFKMVGETEINFPVLASGDKVVVRGFIGSDRSLEGNLEALASASILTGSNEWKVVSSDVSDDDTESSLCFPSYAHDRITQLMRLYAASPFIDEELVLDLVTLKEPCNEEMMSGCIKAEALTLAVEANIVVQGLMAMVTVSRWQILEPDEDAEICIDGTAPDGQPFRPTYSYDDSAAVEAEAASISTPTPLLQLEESIPPKKIRMEWLVLIQ